MNVVLKTTVLSAIVGVFTLSNAALASNDVEGGKPAFKNAKTSKNVVSKGQFDALHKQFDSLQALNNKVIADVAAERTRAEKAEKAHASTVAEIKTVRQNLKDERQAKEAQTKLLEAANADLAKLQQQVAELTAQVKQANAEKEAAVSSRDQYQIMHDRKAVALKNQITKVESAQAAEKRLREMLAKAQENK